MTAERAPRARAVRQEEPPAEEPPAPPPAPPDPYAPTPEERAQALFTGRLADGATRVDIERAIAQRILAAPDADAMMDPILPVQARDISERPLMVFGFQAVKAGGGDDWSVYYLIDAGAMDNGEVLLIRTASANIAAQLEWLGQHGKFPLECRITQTQVPTGEGHYPLWLRPLAAEPQQ